MTSLATEQENNEDTSNEIISNTNALPDYELRSIENWDDLPEVKQELLRGIYAHGFETPSPIQKKAIVPLFVLEIISYFIFLFNSKVEFSPSNFIINFFFEVII